MANLKNITDLPVAETAEGLNLIVNDNGSAKQIPANVISGGVSSWNELEDKPFGEETVTVNKPLNITWDGNGEGLVNFETEGDYYYKVSDLVLTDEQIKLIEMDDFYGDHTVISEAWDFLVNEGAVTKDMVFFNAVLFVRKDNLSIMDITIPEKGIYFARWPENYITTMTTTEPITITETTIKTIDEKFLPIIEKPLFVDIRPANSGATIRGTANMSYTKFRHMLENDVYFGAYICFIGNFAPLVVNLN